MLFYWVSCRFDSSRNDLLPNMPEGRIGWDNTLQHHSTTLLNLPEFTLTSYSVNTGILNPFSFNFTNCSCTSASKRMRSAANGDWRFTFPLPKRVAKPCPNQVRLGRNPKWLCDSCVTYSLKHAGKSLSSPIGILCRENHSLIVYSMLFSTLHQSK